jgi:hypothetical protein
MKESFLFHFLFTGASVLGCSTSNNALTEKYCGLYLGAEQAAATMANVPVCGE